MLWGWVSGSNQPPEISTLLGNIYAKLYVRRFELCMIVNIAVKNVKMLTA